VYVRYTLATRESLTSFEFVHVYDGVGDCTRLQLVNILKCNENAYITQLQQKNSEVVESTKKKASKAGGILAMFFRE
jgi:hypothetical protein